MARIYDVELRNVRIDQGFEDWRLEAEVYLQGDKIGLFLDEGSGGPGALKFCCDLNARRNFYYVAWRYFASYPEIDILALYEYTQKEFVELKGSLPKVSYKEWPDEKVAIFFIDKLVYMYQLEQQYDMAAREGYNSIIVIRYFALKNAKAEPDKIYYMDGSEEDFNIIIMAIEEKNRNYIVAQYNTKSDFEIG